MSAAADLSLLKDLRIRDVRTVSYPGNGVAAGTAAPSDPINIKGANPIAMLALRLSGLLTVASGSSDGTLAPEQPWSLIREIRVRASSSIRPSANGVLRQFDPAAFYNFTTLLERIALPQTALSAAGVQTNTSFSSTLYIPFTVPHSREPRVSLLNPRELDSLQLEIDWGLANDVIVGGDRTSTFTSTQIEVQSIEYADSFSAQNTYSLHTQRLLEYIYNSSALTNERQDIRGLHIPMRFGLKTYTISGTVHTPVNTIITGIRLEIDKVEVKRWSYNQLTLDNQINYGIAPATGYRIIDLMPDGSFDTLLPMRILEGGKERSRIIELVFDTASVANGRFRVYPFDLIPIAA